MNSSYVKVCLTLIVLLLAVISAKPLFWPPVTHAQSPLSRVQFSGDATGFWAFDTLNGRVYVYEHGLCRYVGTIRELGQPLVK